MYPFDKVRKNVEQYVHAYNGAELQRRLAPVLRAAVIDFLRSSNHKVARNFREVYPETEIGTFRDFCASRKLLFNEGSLTEYNQQKQGVLNSFYAQQSQNGAWANGYELRALAVILDLSVQTTTIINGKRNTPYQMHTAESSDSPEISLDCLNECHWSAPKASGTTLGDGNCLYNGIAQELKRTAPQVASVRTSMPESTATTATATHLSSDTFHPTRTQEQKETFHNEAVIFQELQKTAEERRFDTQERLEALSTEEVARMYQDSLQKNLSDYLPGRVKYMAKYCGLNPKDKDNFIHKAIHQGEIAPEYDPFIKELLIDALSTEAWRSEDSYSHYMRQDTSKAAQATSSASELAATTCAEEARAEHEHYNAPQKLDQRNYKFKRV